MSVGWNDLTTERRMIMYGSGLNGQTFPYQQKVLLFFHGCILTPGWILEAYVFDAIANMRKDIWMSRCQSGPFRSHDS